ncbi:Fic family protein [Sinomicrobium kalidii]|nr:Fic family protein [Sinomicrobium kalidii]
MLAKGCRDLLDIRSYRTHDDPMQIVSGPVNRPGLHYEVPPSHQVKKEMDLFISWFNSTESLDLLTRAGIAHLYFESIHPFEDGNGRIGRAVSEKALSQSLQRPTLIAISHTIEHDKKEYYEALHQNSTGLDITEWLIYFCKMVLQALAPEVVFKAL